MRKTAVLVAGLMALFATIAVQATASAKQGVSDATSRLELTASKKKAKRGKAAKAAKKGKAAKRAGKPTQVASAKSCGTFMYRKDGKCVDARAKK